MIEIKRARRGVNRFGVRKYAKVPSENKEGLMYDVAKVRDKGKRSNRYYYVCSCPVNFYSRTSCKHIKAFQKAEHGEKRC